MNCLYIITVKTFTTFTVFKKLNCYWFPEVTDNPYGKSQSNVAQIPGLMFFSCDFLPLYEAAAFVRNTFLYNYTFVGFK
jgi:hypothetical protein